MSSKKIIVGISGASGGAYATRTLELLAQSDVEVHLVVSPLGQRILADELNIKKLDAATLTGDANANLIVYNHRDVGAAIASGSFIHDGMVIVPCTNHTLGALANGTADNLMHRAANVTLKERRKLVLCHREMPLSLIEIRNMAQLTEAGAIIAPANPGFYMLPKTLADVVDFVAGRLLDLLGIEHELKTRWTESEANYKAE